MEIELKLDLRPFSEGLKSAIRMTDSAADQMTRIMQGQKFIPDYSVLENELKRLESQYGSLANKTDQAADKVNEFGASTPGNVQKATSSFGQLGSIVSGVIKQFAMLGLANTYMMQIYNTAAKMISPFADFEESLDELQAKSKANTIEMSRLKTQAEELGAMPGLPVSASDVVQLQIAYTQLGYSIQEIIDGTENTLYLSMLSGKGLGEAASIAGENIKAMGMKVSETGRMTDVMAKSFTTSALNIDKFSESMKYVAPIAANAGYSIEETTALLAKLAERGQHSSIAGTGLRAILSQLADETTGLNQLFGGQVETFDELVVKLKELKDSNFDLADASKYTERESRSVMLALIDSAYELDDYKKSLEGANGSAKEMAKTMTDNMKGAAKGFTSALEALAIKLGEKVSPALLKMIELGTGFVNVLSQIGETSLERTIRELKDMGVATESLIRLQRLQWKYELVEINQKIKAAGIEYEKISDITAEIENNEEKKKAILEEIIRLEEESAENNEREKSSSYDVYDVFNAYSGAYKNLAERKIESLKSEAEQLDKQSTKYSKILADLQKAELLQGKLNELIEEGSKPPENQIDNDINTEEKQKKLDELAALQQKYDLLSIRDSYKRAEEELKIQRDADLQKAIEIGASEEQIRQIKQYYAIEVKQIQAKYTDDRKNNRKEELEAEIALLTKKKELGVATYQEIALAMERYAELMKVIYGEDSQEYINALNNKRVAFMNWGKEQSESFLGLGDEAMKAIGLDDEQRGKIRQNYSVMAGQIGSIYSQLYKNLAADRQADLEGVEARAKAENWTDEQLATEKERINKEYAEKEKKLKKQQQTWNIAETIINTSSAVMRAIKDWGWPLGAIFGGIIAGLGAYHISLIKAQKFAAGGLIGGGHQLIEVNEKGKPEYILNDKAVNTIGVPTLNFINQNPGVIKPLLSGLPAIPSIMKNKYSFGNGGATEGAGFSLSELKKEIIEMKKDVVTAIRAMNLNVVDRGSSEVHLHVSTTDPEIRVRKDEKVRQRIISAGGAA